jgi:hypothetical protein
VYQDYHSRKPEERTDPDQMVKINLNMQSTMIECSAYLKDGGGQKNEWPWMLIKKTNAHYDKWMCQYNKGWVSFANFCTFFFLSSLTKLFLNINRLSTRSRSPSSFAAMVWSQPTTLP